jgi:hypothetical protein
MSKLSERVTALEQKLNLLMNHSHVHGTVKVDLWDADWEMDVAHRNGIKKGKKLAQATTQEANANNS